ncbi:UDP-N-acetylmuramate--L-alanine ligase [Rhodothermus bifroesti]|uniref:UDP-N-acetylmuramate--L-alanine ligase n=1 Tax=Rhodothermus bifroesti TaxID=2823335 RepID=UPI002342E9FC
MFGRVRHVHMVGIGGIGMSSIAEILLLRGFRVTGSDLKRSEITDRLEQLGATVYEGHRPEHIEGADVVVYSSAVRPQDNPETLEALRRRIPLIPRAEMLGELMRMKLGIGVAGTHGKTTTTSMVGLVVAEGGFDPTIIVGGKVTAFDSNAVAGEGDLIVIEADEYDRTFLRLTPTWAVVTSIEAEHLDIYRDLDDLLEAFRQFASSVPFFGAAILCLDDPNVQALMGKLDRRIRTYGLARQAEVRAENVRFEGFGSSFEVMVEGVSLGEMHLQVPGLHNVRNALAAVTVGLELDIPFARIRAGLERFTGVRRRFERLGEVQGILVIDDYAHHPTEIRVTLEAATTAMPDRRLVAVFQPHLYSRTRDFQEAFARAFVDADVLVVTEIYGAREAPIPGVSGALIADLARRFGHRDVHYVPELTQLPRYLQEHVLRPGDAVLFLGAGDIWRAARALLETLPHWAWPKSQSISPSHAAS